MKWSSQRKDDKLERKRETCASLSIHDHVSFVGEGLNDDVNEARVLLMCSPPWHFVMHQLVLLVRKVLK